MSYFSMQIISKMGRVRFPKWQVRDDDFMFVSSEYPRKSFLLATRKSFFIVDNN